MFIYAANQPQVATENSYKLTTQATNKTLCRLGYQKAALGLTKKLSKYPSGSTPTLSIPNFNAYTNEKLI